MSELSGFHLEIDGVKPDEVSVTVTDTTLIVCLGDEFNLIMDHKSGEAMLQKLIKAFNWWHVEKEDEARDE